MRLTMANTLAYYCKELITAVIFVVILGYVLASIILQAYKYSGFK
jgi:hypothetical protein